MPKKSDAKNVDFKETLWKAADKLRNQMDAAEYKHIVLGLIFLKYISDTFDTQKNKIKEMVSDQKSDLFISEDPKVYEKELEDRDYYTQDNVFWVPQKARWETIRAQAKQPEIGSIIDDSMSKLEEENNFLKGKLDKRFGRTVLSEGILGQLIDLISTISFDKDKKTLDFLGEVYEYFLGQFASAEGKKGGQFYTPSFVVKTLVEIINPIKGRVYDPCCGSGGMFVQSENFIKAHGGKIDDISIYGQESNPTTWRLAAMNMAIRGFSADLGNSAGDTFSEDKFPDLKFDYILMNPPFNDSDWGAEKFEGDKRWSYGMPPEGNANYAWIQHVLWKLKNDGRAGIVMSNGSLSGKKKELEIRKKIVHDDLIEGIISLPSQLFYNTPIPVCLWIFNKDKIKNKNRILFIDGWKLGKNLNRKQKILTENDITLISDIFSNWRKNKDYKDISGFCKSTEIDEIVKNNYFLTPGRYVGYITQKKEEVLKNEIIKKNQQLSIIKKNKEDCLKRIILNLNSIPGFKNLNSFKKDPSDFIKTILTSNYDKYIFQKALYKSWFVDFVPILEKKNNILKNFNKDIVDLFPKDLENSEMGKIPKGWELKKLSDYYTLSKGLSYKGKNLSETQEGSPMLNLGCFIKDGKFSIQNFKYYTGEFKDHHICHPGDLLIANTDITQDREVIGSPIILPEIETDEKIIFTHHVFKATKKLKTSYLSNEFTYLTLLSERFRARAGGFAIGTTVLAMPQDTFEDYLFIYPGEKIIKEFEKITEDFSKLYETNFAFESKFAIFQKPLNELIISGNIDNEYLSKILK